MTWSVDLCDNWERIGQLQDTAFRFNAVERFNEVGEWTLTFPDQSPSWSSYTDDEGFQQLFTPRHVDTIRLVEDRVVRFAGFVAETSAGSGGVERVYDASGVHWEMSGPDLWDLLRRRVAFPQPSQGNPSLWSSAHDLNSGQASTVLASYLSDNLGAGAVADRQIAGFSVVDTTTGPSWSWSARLQPVYELARRILEDGELTIRWTVGFDGAITATVKATTDLSSSVILSDQADLVSVRSRQVPYRSTWVVVGGDGTGTGRTFRVASRAELTGLDRRERFIDSSSLDEAAEVQLLATSNLRLDSTTWVVSGEPGDLVTTEYGFGRSVFPGDKVTIQTAGQRFTVPVASISYQITEERQVIRPLLGDSTPDVLKALMRRLDRLERGGDNRIA